MSERANRDETSLRSVTFEPVELGGTGRARVVLPGPDAGLMDRIAAARTIEEFTEVVAANPSSMDAWAALGERYEQAGSTVANAVAAYACYRVGYHRGLDALRGNGWNGAQLVRWADEPNRGFLRCVSGLQRMAARIGEGSEAERCARFLDDLDPDWTPSSR